MQLTVHHPQSFTPGVKPVSSTNLFLCRLPMPLGLPFYGTELGLLLLISFYVLVFKSTAPSRVDPLKPSTKRFSPPLPCFPSPFPLPI